ncbi:DJ-1/PfpI family protein [Sphingomonas sp. IC-11]|uniref:DJ-1/PfpI family protein n=1 Tax=Sphingomonas sp. IC-11 TaxID=2898528 RepID=UPI001E3A4928|nr:DJ-1/PfpI family protein [Sphingomonas sp. IC-11]MCD2315041.1 DJ-1/PfpI family protein [Sphingomonas sp. IC-11]
MRVVFLLFPSLTQLDLTGPAQVLARLGGDARQDLVWRSRDPVMTDAGFAIVPTATFDEVASVDILCIPGGVGVNAVIADDEVMGWVQEVGAKATWVTSVCTGSLILGAAGLLRGYRATSHWAWRDMLSLFGATPTTERVVIDRNRVTGGGVTAGIDFALSLTALLRGEAHARAVQLSMEYDPAPPFDAGSPDRAGEPLVSLFQERMERLAPGREKELRALAIKRGFAAG